MNDLQICRFACVWFAKGRVSIFNECEAYLNPPHCWFLTGPGATVPGRNSIERVAAVKKWNIHKDSQSKWQRSLFSISGCFALAVWAGNRRWHPIKDDTLMCSSALNSGNFLSYTQTDAARLAKVWCCFQSFPPLSPYFERIHLVADRFRDADAQRFFFANLLTS